MPDTSEEQQNAEKDYYQILGVRRHASFEEIKKAYRVLAQKYHPDHGNSNSVEQFVEVTKAYETLLDPELRNEYNKAMGYEHAEITEEEPDEPEPEPEDKKRKVSIDGHLAASEDRWDTLRGKLGEHDLKVSHKAALADPNAAESELPSDEITPWGEEDEKDKPKRFSFGGVVGNLLGKKRSESAKKRADLKEQFRREFEERIHPKQPAVKTAPKKPVAPKEEEDLGNTGFEQRGTRIFQFYVNSLERYLGTERELVLPGSDRGEIRRIKVTVPAGTEPGTVMEVSRGWERFNVRIDVKPDLYYAVNGFDLLVNVPITFSEALSGVSLHVPTIEGSVDITVPAMFQAGDSVRIDGMGILNPDSPERERGAVIAYPFIVPPTNITSMLKDAVNVINGQYGGSSVRDAFPVRFEDVRSLREWDVSTVFPLVITLGEAIDGCSIEIPTAKGRSNVTVPAPWKFEEKIILDGLGRQTHESGPGDLLVLPQIALPKDIGPATFGASVAIDQHYTQAVRAGMPKRLKKSESDGKKKR